MNIMLATKRLTLTFGALTLLSITSPSHAMISGAEGNKPMRNMGWPTGSEKLANLKSRVSWWEGPPFGGGNYHFEYRVKSTADINRALQVFSHIKAPELQPVVHDDSHNSFWLRDEKNPRIDFEFVIWVPRNYHRLYNKPNSLIFSDHPDYRSPVPPPLIHLHLGGSVSIGTRSRSQRM